MNTFIVQWIVLGFLEEHDLSKNMVYAYACEPAVPRRMIARELNLVAVRLNIDTTMNEFNFYVVAVGDKFSTTVCIHTTIYCT